jgi:hypothetical protein
MTTLLSWYHITIYQMRLDQFLGNIKTHDPSPLRALAAIACINAEVLRGHLLQGSPR